MTNAPPPRISPLPGPAWTEAARDVFAMLGGSEAREKGPNNNVIQTLATHPALAKAFLTFNIHLLLHSSLPPRLRELVILRTLWTNRCEYDWRHHQLLGARVGLTPDDIAAVQEGPEATPWTDLERSALCAADQLGDGGEIDDATWQALAGALDERQLMDLLFTVGAYTMISWSLNNLRVQLEPGMPRGLGVTGAEG